MTVPSLELLVRHSYADLGDVRLHYVEAGPADGPLVVLLHGFPEFWYSWRRQLPALAEAGFRAVAPDMRGYNLSDKPAGVRAYDIRRLARDIDRLIEALGAERASVVGHNWGGGVAWAFAMFYPQRLNRLVIMNVPHPVRLQQGLFTPGQLLRSWYIFFFQLPLLPELSLRAANFRSLRQALRRDRVRKDAFTEADIDRYVAAMAQPGALTGSINYYRALVRRGSAAARRLQRRVDAPVLVLWGEQDRYLKQDLADPPPGLVPNATVHRLPNAGHWVQLDEPERVNELLLSFLQAAQASSITA